jgi:hypothetical protein
MSRTYTAVYNAYTMQRIRLLAPVAHLLILERSPAASKSLSARLAATLRYRVGLALTGDAIVERGGAGPQADSDVQAEKRGGGAVGGEAERALSGDSLLRVAGA